MRYTRNITEARVETVKALAKQAGLKYVVPTSKATYEGLYAYRAYGGVQLVAIIEGSTGQTTLKDGFGTEREACLWLDGMIAALRSLTERAAE